jgi:NADPH-dependent 2,4-dienoyl-CoA reductase/sulfur reductase-like enzyme
MLRASTGCRPWTTGQRLLDELAGSPRRAVVVGGGYIGIEMAEAMVNRGLSLTPADRPVSRWRRWTRTWAGWCTRRWRGLGIDVRTSVTLRGFDVDDAGHVRAVTTDDGTFPGATSSCSAPASVRRPVGREAGLSLGDGEAW